MLSSARFSISKSLDTHELLQFVPFPRCTGSPTYVLYYSPLFLPLREVGARNEEAERAPSSARLYLSFSPSSRLSHYVPYSFSSVYLLRDLGVSFLLSLDLTQIPRITQTRWLKPSGATTDKRNPVLGIRFLYLPIMVVICPGKQSLPSSPGIFSLLCYRETRRVYFKCVRSPPFLYTRPHMRLYAYATFFFLLLQTIPLGKSTYKSFWEKKIYLDMVLVDRIVGKNFE